MSNSTTYMLIVLVSVFLSVEIPMAIVTLLHVLININILKLEEAVYLDVVQKIRITIIITNFVIMLSFPLNFAIYCGMSAQFRNTFNSLISGCWRLKGHQRANEMECLQQQETTGSLAIVGDGTSMTAVRQVSTQVSNPNGNLN